MDELKAPALIRPGRDAFSNMADGVETPRYDVADLSAGIVHIGVGNFHRAHQAWYTHRLMQRGSARDWAIVGAGVRDGDAAMREKLLAQDGLTTLLELRPDGISAEIVGSMIDFAPVEPDNAALIACMADPAIRIVSLTVTEGGYFLDAAGAFDAGHPEVQADAAGPDRPRTAFGAIVAALSLRRARGEGPFSVQSCDNLRGNGDVARSVVVGLARLSDPGLADWIDAHGAFPNSMVDCIVPATGPEALEQVRALGLDDAAPVAHEPYRAWIIEDAFCAGRPNWDEVGAVFTDRVHDYEAMKIRILNAGHQVLANAGELLGAETIADCVAHPAIGAFFRKVQAEEIAPYVTATPDTTPLEYVALIEDRFANPAIRDTTRRVAFDGSSRHPGFILPVLQDALAAKGGIDGLCLVEALWARMCAGVREDGSTIAPNDPNWAALQAAALSARGRPSDWLSLTGAYGDLADDARVVKGFDRWLRHVWNHGTEDALIEYAGPPR